MFTPIYFRTFRWQLSRHDSRIILYSSDFLAIKYLTLIFRTHEKPIALAQWIIRMIEILERARCTAARCELRFRADEPQESAAAFAASVGKASHTEIFVCVRVCMCTYVCVCVCARCIRMPRRAEIRAVHTGWFSIGWPPGVGGRSNHSPLALLFLCNRQLVPLADKVVACECNAARPALSRKESQLASGRTRFVKREINRDF